MVRLEWITRELQHARESGNTVLAYFLGIYMDSFIPMYLSRDIPTTFSNPHPKFIPPSQHSLPDYITNLDIVIGNDERAIQRVLIKSFSFIRNRKHGISHTAAECTDFMYKCAWASAVGNYTHAKFSHPHALTTIDDRIEALSRIKHITEQHTAVIASEYIVAKMPVHPFRAAPDIRWSDYVERSAYNADTTIRGCKNIPEPRIIAFNHIELPVASHIYYDYCLMPTGHRKTWICTTCFGISAPIAKRVRGFKQIAIPIDPWGPPMSENPPIFCPKCRTTQLRFMDLHGLMVCLGRKFTMVVCPEPQCNMISIKTGPITTTTCNKCIERKSGVEKICYRQRHKIKPNECYKQVAIDVVSGKVVTLDVCKYHYSEDVEIIHQLTE